jgi:uncharacterized protein YkwD
MLRLMRGRGLLVVCAAFLAFAAPGGAVSTAGLTGTERALLSEMNRVRAANGLPGLRVDWRLQRAARAHSSAMIQRDFFSHAGFAQRMRASGARGPIFGENLAWGTGSRGSASAIVGQWLASPAHRVNLLRRGFVRVGVAAPSGNFQGYSASVATADFAGR